MATAKETVTELLKHADIEVNGNRPYDIQIHNELFYERVLKTQQLGFGESYMDGWWDASRLDELICKLLSSDIRQSLPLNTTTLKAVFAALVVNQQSIFRAKQNASHHYNIGFDLYERMLDKQMIYSCGYWESAKTLDAAQEAKLDLICRKLHLQKGMKLLDIGCGWGGFAAFASEKYGVEVIGITPARDQVDVARERTKGLPVTILQQDYREAVGTFDRIVSIGMLEHVGPKNYRQFFSRCTELLAKNGLMLHHFIGRNRSVWSTDPWINKYIFPGGVIPTLMQISRASERKFIIEDVQNFGPYYDTTLMAWYKNFVEHYPEIKDTYDERFYRMWTYYLLSCAGAFRARHLQLYQLVMRHIVPSQTYKAIR